MKIAVTIVACLVALSQYVEGYSYVRGAVLEQPSDQFAAIRIACANSIGLPSWELYKGNKPDFFNDHHAKEYTRCYLSNLNVLTPAGRFNPQVLIKMVGEELKYPIYACDAYTKAIADPWDLSYNLVKCLDDHNAQLLTAIGLLHPASY